MDVETLTEMGKKGVFCVGKLDRYLGKMKATAYRADILDKMVKAYKYIEKLPLSPADKSGIKPDYQGFFYLLIFRPFDTPWRKVEGCKDCFMPKKVVNMKKPHVCGKNLGCGPFHKPRGTNSFVCPGCLAVFRGSEVGRYMCHLISEHGSWGETVE